MQPPLLLVEREMLSIRYSYGMCKLRTGKKGQLMQQVLAQTLIKAYNSMMRYVALLDTRLLVFDFPLYHEPPMPSLLSLCGKLKS